MWLGVTWTQQSWVPGAPGAPSHPTLGDGSDTGDSGLSGSSSWVLLLVCHPSHSQSIPLGYTVPL